MIGIGSTWGAITFVNALATGVGSAAAIDLPVRAEVEGWTSQGRRATDSIEPACDSDLTRAALAAARGLWFPGDGTSLRLSVRSTLPPGRGLKSSSAVAAAILLAGAGAAGAPVDREAIARTTAEVNRRVGLSETGAFDDALASLEGGVVVTNNRRQLVLRRDVLPRDWKVVLWIPPTSHAPSPSLAHRFAEERERGQAAVAAAELGRWLDALEANSALVERVMGYDYGLLRGDLRRRGALGSGVSGMGPSLAAIVREEHLAEIRATFPSTLGDIVPVGFVAPARPPSAP
ncbi:MAG: shikimate kinase [Thermoplasmata archaeon]|nr:shikimate kinase [Thermoplasmata archaeon]